MFTLTLQLGSPDSCLAAISATEAELWHLHFGHNGSVETKRRIEHTRPVVKSHSPDYSVGNARVAGYSRTNSGNWHEFRINASQNREPNTSAHRYNQFCCKFKESSVDVISEKEQGNEYFKQKKTDTGTTKGSKAEPKKKMVKKNRVWDDSPPEVKLDFTDSVDEKGDDNVKFFAVTEGESMMDKEEIVSSDSEVEEDEQVEGDGKGETKKGCFSSMFQSIAEKVNLEKADLEQALKALKDRLMTKNVAEKIAEKLCESVAASLEGKKLASFTRVSSTVQAAMEEALVRIHIRVHAAKDIHLVSSRRNTTSYNQV
ncbi:hypothetical protein Drorol1_Dr00027497 [Drosera rotundifolia]